MKRVIALLFLLTAAALPASYPPRLSASARVDLGGPWQFRVDPQREGIPSGWHEAPPADTETVTVPHTWGTGRHEDHLGAAWYFKRVSLPAALGNEHVELHIGAAFYRARVFLNGNEVGAHEGGHSSFFFDVTPLVRRENLIAIEVDNTPADVRSRQPGTGQIFHR